jgi:hypothetical protein
MGEIRGEGEQGTEVARTYRVKRDRHRQMIGSNSAKENMGSNVKKNKAI